jgi:hypothetical protein
MAIAAWVSRSARSDGDAANAPLASKAIPTKFAVLRRKTGMHAARVK